ncbi:hypothetical protein HanRHA438_Chr15g0725871 [Helianthus annuus]|nr:hypothetical protein HanIR_Chr15g0776431 [Helianthus annuus]KAJ0846528.1 hypothetical protein HanRHA438_Chr15g0725871 [Helianthus annuus]
MAFVSLHVKALEVPSPLSPYATATMDSNLFVFFFLFNVCQVQTNMLYRVKNEIHKLI